ncbi:MAG: ABC transporter ATP-binding protein [Thermoplasmata archaeon]
MPDEPTLLSVRELDAAWGAAPVLRSVSFDLHEGEVLALLGPNGSGKTTLLRGLAGLDPVRGGSIRLRGAEIRRLPAHRRGIGMVSQDSSLFPHRTVWENVAYGPQVQRWSPTQVDARVTELLDQFSIGPFADRYPGALSGGEQQRVALARALAPRPALLLLDEPFAAVDPELRGELRAEFREVLHRQRASAIHVTHDRDEGFFLGDRLLILLEGRLVQSGPPESIWDRPNGAPVARFLGYNLLPREGRIVGVLPEQLRLGSPDEEGVPAQVVRSGFVGGGRSIELRLEGGARAEARRPRSEPAPLPGRTVRLRWDDQVEIGDEPEDGTPRR